MSDPKGLIGKVKAMGDQAMTDFANELLSNPKFAKALGKAIQRAMAAKGALDKNLQLVFNAVNLPTKADHEKLIRRVEKTNQTIAGLESRIDDLVARIERLSAKTAPKKKPAKKKSK
jgi:hypothetical protein